jgi:hypothetical protein
LEVLISLLLDCLTKELSGRRGAHHFFYALETFRWKLTGLLVEKYRDIAIPILSDQFRHGFDHLVHKTCSQRNVKAMHEAKIGLNTF